MQLSRDALLRAYCQMATIRQFEERLHEEIKTGRIPFEGDPRCYRAKGEIDRLRETRDALKIFRDRVGEFEPVDIADLAVIDAEVTALIDAAVAAARNGVPRDPADVTANVYAAY